MPTELNEEERARLILLESAALGAPQVVMPSPDASSEVLKIKELGKSVDQTNRMRVHAQGETAPSIWTRGVVQSLSCRVASQQSWVHGWKSAMQRFTTPFQKKTMFVSPAHFQTFRRGGTHGGVHWRDDAVRTRMTNAGTGCAEFELARRLTQVPQPGNEEGSHRPAVVRIAKVSLRQTINEGWTSHVR